MSNTAATLEVTVFMSVPRTCQNATDFRLLMRFMLRKKDGHGAIAKNMLIVFNSITQPAQYFLPSTIF